MEAGASVAKAVLTSRKLTEVARCFGDDIIEEPEDDAAKGLVVFGDVELRVG